MLVLPFDPEVAIADWSSLRRKMVRNCPDSFSRDEWAYMMAFLDAENLRRPFADSFGTQSDQPGDDRVRYVHKPRGRVAVWLPSNVSLLGPLTLVLMSLTGNALLLKGGSDSASLTGDFLAFALEHLPEGRLRSYLVSRIQFARFGRADAANAEYAAQADVRVVFGSDDAANAVHALSHPSDSVGISFVDRRSEAWLDLDRVTDGLLDALVKVFEIYGQAGCTSPRRVVVLNGGYDQVLEVRARLASRWARLNAEALMHVASENVMARQWAAAEGWDAVMTDDGGAVLGVGAAHFEPVTAPRFLALVGATLDEALETLPPNIQTVGHAFGAHSLNRLFDIVGRSAVKRIVPLAEMHHFSHVWDGEAFWRQAFVQVEVRA